MEKADFCEGNCIVCLSFTDEFDEKIEADADIEKIVPSRKMFATCMIGLIEEYLMVIVIVSKACLIML